MYRVTNIKEFTSRCSKCVKCELHHGRKQVVNGEGCLKSGAIMIIGGSTGFREDLTGLPFVGAPGELLMEILANHNLHIPAIKSLMKSRGHFMDFEKLRVELNAFYYFTNLVRCHHPDNDDPSRNSIKSCRDWLMEEIYIVDPSLIITLGKIAFQFVTGSKLGINLERGKFSIAAIPSQIQGADNLKYLVMPCLHPAFLLRRGDFALPAPHSKQLVDYTFSDFTRAHRVADEYNLIHFDIPKPQRGKQ